MNELMDRLFPNKQNPDKDHVQQELTNDFIAALLLRGELSPDQVAQNFANAYMPLLNWLGTHRQDEIIKKAMEETHLDLSHLLEEQEDDNPLDLDPGLAQALSSLQRESGMRTLSDFEDA
ncbi:MAG TPA: hypothetical protein VL461_12295 [Dictyobacter sp.]|jgi:hypothetical protein|nr:hypothetical protein [Dictyobacter sp.]